MNQTSKRVKGTAKAATAAATVEAATAAAATTSTTTATTAIKIEQNNSSRNGSGSVTAQNGQTLLIKNYCLTDSTGVRNDDVCQ